MLEINNILKKYLGTVWILTFFKGSDRQCNQIYFTLKEWPSMYDGWTEIAVL